MRDRTLALAWIVLALVFAVMLLYELGKWRSISTQGARAAGERVRLTAEIRAKEEEIVKEMRANAVRLQEMQRTAAGGDPSVFLTRLADLAREKRMKVIGIGPLERQATAQFNKSWHTIQLVAPYRELRELAARVEGEKGILEDMALTVPRETAGPGAANLDEVEAKFKMTGLELTAEAAGNGAFAREIRRIAADVRSRWSVLARSSFTGSSLSARPFPRSRSGGRR